MQTELKRAVFTSQHHNKLAEWLYEYKQLKHIRRNKMFDDLVDTFIIRLAYDNPRFMPRKFSAVIEFGPFKEEASKPTDRKDLSPKENIGEVTRSKP